MILLVLKYGLKIEVDDNYVTNIVLEVPRVLSDVIFSIDHQCSGEQGIIKFSQGEKEIAITRVVDYIPNPIGVSCNNKKIINQLYKELLETSKNKYIEQTAEINRLIINLLDSLISDSTYMISSDSNPELDLLTVFKMYGITIQDANENYCEQLINYFKSMNKICGIKIFVVLNLKQFFGNDELLDIYEFCRYNEITLINIEGRETEHIENEKYYILDRDFCIIES